MHIPKPAPCRERDYTLTLGEIANIMSMVLKQGPSAAVHLDYLLTNL
jgi:hypothetical protein